MTTAPTVHLGLEVARLHGILAVRPGSDVFHVYTGPRSRRTGRIPRGARPVGNCRVGRLVELERDGSSLDLAGRRLCGRCSARLASRGRRAEQLTSRDDFLRVYGGRAGVTLGDLVTALVMCASSDENRRVAYVASVVHGFCEPTANPRPTQPGRGQARYDFEVELRRRRKDLVAAERTPEEIEAAAIAREVDQARQAQINTARRKADARDRALDRRLRGGFLLPHEKALVESA